LKGKTLTTNYQGRSVPSCERESVLGLDLVYVGQLGELLNELGFLVPEVSWILAQSLHLPDLRVDLRNLLGQTIDLRNILDDRPIQAGLDGIQVLFGRVEVARKILCRRENRVTRRKAGRLSGKLADAIEESREVGSDTLCGVGKQALHLLQSTILRLCTALLLVLFSDSNLENLVANT
jgi:hypothetical protein